MTRLAAISFDDGYLEYVKGAVLLSKLGVKATFYIITHLKSWEEKSLLTEKPELIAEIAELGHEIGSHTCTHKDLRQLQSSNLIYELKTSKNFLEDVTGREILGIAYPWGFYDSRVLTIVSNIYHYGRTTEYRLSGGVLLNALPRSKYEIGAIAGLAMRGGFQRMLENLLRVKHWHLVLYTHLVQPVKLVALIKVMRSINVKFVTVSELVDHLVREHGLK
jgi:peptidoglycan/xylan/chitin deacetylase (PgdA/CDA1 family)